MPSLIEIGPLVWTLLPVDERKHVTQCSDYDTGWTIGVLLPAEVERGICLFTTTSRPSLPTQSPIRWVSPG